MLKKFLWRCAVVGVMGGSALCAASAFAGLMAHVVTEAENGVGSIGTAGDVKTCPGCQASISSTGTVTSATFGTSQSDSSARATADYGILKTFATAASNGHFGEARATATASFSDIFTINSPGLAGQDGAVVVALEFNYASSLSGEASSQVTLVLKLFNTFPADVYQRSLQFNSDGHGAVQSDSFDPPHVVTPFSTSILATVDFVFGQPVGFAATLEVKGGGFFDEAFTLDAEHSAFWGGFRSVTDANGNAVDYTLGTGSQADWSKSFSPSTVSVPEPDTYALMLACLCAVGFVLRRRR